MTKRIRENICGNCKHEIEVQTTTKQIFDTKTKKLKMVTLVFNVTHLRNSAMCLETNCQCIDPTGRDTKLVGARHPFNKVWNQDSLQGFIKW